MTHHHGAHHHAHDHGADDEAALADLLDLDAQVLHSYWADAVTWVAQAASPTARILDLGAGTGTGTIALARLFPGADVLAVDVSELMLGRIRAKAADLGLADRIRTVQADLDGAWPATDPVDITWASMSLHHLADPDRALRDVFAMTRPGGLLAVVEFSEPLRFLPREMGLGRPGLEDRCLDLLSQERARSLPELGSQWAPRLAAAGFAGISERTFAIDVTAPYPPGTARYAQQWLRRLRSRVADQLDPDDLATLDTLLDGDGPESVPRRDDLQIRGSRTVTLARRS